MDNPITVSHTGPLIATVLEPMGGGPGGMTGGADSGRRYNLTVRPERIERPQLYQLRGAPSGGLVTCWFIRSAVLRELPIVDVAFNKYGSGVCAAIAAISHLQSRICVRDHGFTVNHPSRVRRYPADVAVQQRMAYINQLNSPLQFEGQKG
jgi:hypothetical protein